jgi:hypothetical protein
VQVKQKIEINDIVEFTDEFNQTQSGTVISTDTYGNPGSLGIVNDHTDGGCYVRKPEEVVLVQEAEQSQ